MQRWRDTSEDLKPQIANLCMQVGASMPVPSEPAPLTTRQPSCIRAYLGSCSSGDKGLALPSQAADGAERSGRDCRCYQRTGCCSLDEGGQQGVACSYVAVVDVVRQLCAAMQHAGLVGTAAWWCGRSKAV